MKSVSPILLRQKRIIDYLILMICPAMVGVAVIVSLVEQSGDVVRVYAWIALTVELLICYAPASAFIQSSGGKKRFGLNGISVREWFFSILLGVAVYSLFVALEAPLNDLLVKLGMTRLPGYETPGGWRFFACVLLMGIIPAIAEETLFHGALLFSWLPHGKTAAIWHSAFMFALVQINPSVFPLLVLVGLLFAHVSERSGSIYPCIAMYATNNILSLLFSYLVSNDLVKIPTDPLIYAVFGAVLGLTAYFCLMRIVTRRREIVREMAQTLYKAVLDAIGRDEKKEAANLESCEIEQTDIKQSETMANDDRILLVPGKLLVTLTYIFLLVFNGLFLAMMFLYG